LGDATSTTSMPIRLKPRRPRKISSAWWLEQGRGKAGDIGGQVHRLVADMGADQLGGLLRGAAPVASSPPSSRGKPAPAARAAPWVANGQLRELLPNEAGFSVQFRLTRHRGREPSEPQQALNEDLLANFID
jgi:hypothetical protein